MPIDPGRDRSPVRGSELDRQRASTERRAAARPPCPHYPHCIGCPLIDMPYPRQLERKRVLVSDAVAHYPALADITVPPVTPSPRRFGYRARVKLVVRRNRDQVALGLYAPGSHRVIDISSCPVHPRRVNQVAHYLKTKLSQLGVAPYDERDDSGTLRYVDFRYSATRDEVSLTLVTRHAAFPRSAVLASSLLKRFPFVTGVIQNINEGRGNVIWGSRFVTLGGRDTIMDRAGDLKLVFPPGAFSQANPFTAQRIYAEAQRLAALKGSETILDLYCGVGPISLCLAPSARQAWGIDESEPAIDAAKQNARRNGRGNCRFIAGDVVEALSRLTQNVSPFDLVVLNPPRKGVQPAAMKAILEFGAPKLIYISCEATTLARDLDRLVSAGYRPERLALFDMFPQTEEVESVALLANAWSR